MNSNWSPYQMETNRILWQTDQWYFPGFWQRMWFHKWDLEWPCRPGHTVSIQQHQLKCGRLWNWKQQWTQEKTAANLIPSSSHYKALWWMALGLADYCLLCCSSPGNYAAYDVLTDSNWMWTANSLFPPSCSSTALSFAFDRCPPRLTPWLPQCQSCALNSEATSLWI